MLFEFSESEGFFNAQQGGGSIKINYILTPIDYLISLYIQIIQVIPADIVVYEEQIKPYDMLEIKNK